MDEMTVVLALLIASYAAVAVAAYMIGSRAGFRRGSAQAGGGGGGSPGPYHAISEARGRVVFTRSP